MNDQDKAVPDTFQRAVDAFQGAFGAKGLNPKDAIGSDKLPLELWPPSATAVGCLGIFDGMLKYGRTNWRAAPVLASIYIAALKRHTDGFFEGETIDPESGIPHLAGILANGAILVDAGAAGSLVDDRQYPGGYRKLVDELTPHVARLRTKHAGKRPKHFTIADTQLDTTVRVAVGVIVDAKNRVFLQRRRLNDENFGGLWECPGGGIESGETPFGALRRELREELGIDTLATRLIWRGANEGYQGRRFEFSFFHVQQYKGVIKPRDGQAGHGWYRPHGCRKALTPANLLAWPEVTGQAMRADGESECVDRRRRRRR